MKISHDYEYDLEKRAFISKEIDKDIPVCQTFTIPAGMKTISGFAVKLYRNGEPGDIEYRIGSSCGADDIASGTLNRDRIIPFYELLYRDFFDPIPVTEGNVYYLYIKPVSGSLPYDGYRIFGPHPGDSAGYKDDIIDRMHWQVRGELYTKYVPQEGLPPYDGGYGIDKNG